MKKTALLIALSCFVATNSYAVSPYISAKAKMAFSQNSVKVQNGKAYKIDNNVVGANFAAGLQKSFNAGNWRTEIEYAKNANAEKKKNNHNNIAKTQAFFLNTYFDFDINQPVMPYIGGGIGYGRAQFVTPTYKKNRDDFAYNLGAGVVYDINENLSFDFGYRYVRYLDSNRTHTNSLGAYEKSTFKSEAHEILAGLRYNFGDL